MSVDTSPLPLQPVRAVIFDLDDTLLASGHLESFRLNRNQRGLEDALPGLSAPSGLHEQLRRLSQRVPLGIVTTSPRWYAERILAHLYPDIRWQAVVTYVDVQRRKPDPQGLLLAVSQMKLEPSSEVAYVGDQETDLEAARRGGLLPVNAAWCVNVGQNQELSLHHPAELACLQPVRAAVSAACERLLTLLQLPGVGRTTALNTMNEAGLGLGDLPQDPRITKALQQPGAWEKASETAQQILTASTALDVHLMCPADPEYPPALLGMGKEQPALLYVQGRLSALPGLAVIGTREPTRHGLEVTRRITNHFAPDHSIVSGLALGVDSMAHQAALQAGGHTVAVLGHGHGHTFPRQNAALAAEILESGGALVSEYPPHTPVLPHYFVERDRIQAGLADATIMVQTDVQGGSWHAARKALAYGRPLGYPVPTERDTAHEEEKIQGILLLEQGTPAQKVAQLKCREADLQRVFRISGREDYAAFSRLLANRGIL
ncbi:HAD family hydrolase [Deinococcus cavernae]|uniref:HAD family hydrolase n=1 Tax=Deinococcus cavernae TaxID=2320857 RepID=A0A418VHJ3_9DEIO|nr:HAD-IA family hydrolase [Deinococcus cavernae]RJF75609.1 HAD family hydrolase [Deinococcus cavernae]